MRPPHPAPTFVTIAKRPSIGTGRRTYRTDLGRPASIISIIQKNISGLTNQIGPIRDPGVEQHSSSVDQPPPVARMTHAVTEPRPSQLFAVQDRWPVANCAKGLHDRHAGIACCRFPIVIRQSSEAQIFMTSDSDVPISHLQRRKIEGRVLIPFIETLREKLGEDVAAKFSIRPSAGSPWTMAGDGPRPTGRAWIR